MGRGRGQTASSKQAEEVSPQEKLNVQQQSRKERRLLRAHYREVKDSIAGGKDELTSLDSERFADCYRRIQSLHSQVQKPREQISDGEALLDMAATLVDTAKGANRKSGPTPSDFIAAVVRKFQVKSRRKNRDEEGVDIDWGKLGLEACVILRQAPGLTTLVGPMDSQPKPKRTYTARGRRQNPGLLTQPDELNGASSSQEKQETDANMETMFEKLRNERCIRFEYLILNRTSFAQTVENIFSFSFLVKDGRVEIKIEADGTHLVVPRNAPSRQDTESGSVPNTQFVFGFGFADWELMKAMVPEGKEAMPHRSRTELCSLQENKTPVRIRSRNRARETSTQEEVEEERPAKKGRKL